MHILITGTFYNEGWLNSHLLPLVKTESIEKIYLVVDRSWAMINKVEYILPPIWMSKILGRSASRIYMVFHTAIDKKPDILMGYHIMPNSVVCLAAASMIGAHSAYQMTGGPIQIIGGGPGSENVLLRRLRRNSKILEKITFSMVKQFDLIVARGKNAVDFLSQRKLGSSNIIITGGIDTNNFKPDGRQIEFDLVCVSRLNKYKGIEFLLDVLSRIHKIRPNIRLSIVGDGNLKSDLEAQAVDLGIANNVTFQGHRTDVVNMLQNARVFILTSPSEGMSIAMLEAMATGLPVAVTDVGDLSDAVINGETGILLPPNNRDLASSILIKLLDNEESLRRMSFKARKLILNQYSVEAISNRWNKYFVSNYSQQQ